MNGAEDFGHKPWFTCLPDFTKGYACARCRQRERRVWLDEHEQPRSHVMTVGVPWPCTSAVVLGLVPRQSA